MKKNLIILISISIISVNLSAKTIVNDNYFNNKTINWNIENSPYIIQKNINISSSTLNINNAEIIFENGSINLFNNSFVNINNVNISGTSSVYSLSSFNSNISIKNLSINTKQFLQAYNTDLNIDNLKSKNSFNENLFSIYSNSNLYLTNSRIENYQGNVFDINNSNIIKIQNNEFINNEKVINLGFANIANINKNDFENNNISIESYMYDYDNKNINIEDNFFQKEKSKIYLFKEMIPDGEKNILIGPFLINIFSKDKNVKKQEYCCSNILFLPGIMGSRLYMFNNLEKQQNQLWEPNRNTDVKKLYLNNLGESINNVFTKDVILKTNIFGILSFIDQNIYKDFAIYLEKIKKDKIINDYNFSPYDWRMSPDYILSYGIKTQEKNIDLIKTLKDLQKTSKTGKVTIVTHSNGGLIAKKLLIELKKQNLENIIDNIVFVAMPEYGTAQAITSLVSGHQQSLASGLLMKTSVAKDLAKNMSTAYTLLPSEKYYYFNTNSNKSLHQNIIKNYPDLNNSLNEKAEKLHHELDNIIYPSNINIYQILGTGINTMYDIKIDNKNTSKDFLKIIPLYDKNGDGIVQDIYSSRYGTTTFINLENTKYKHSNIMNNDKVINIINDIIYKKQFIYNSALDYNKIIKNNNYKLLKITQSQEKEGINNINQYLSKLDISLSLGITKLNDGSNNTLYIDKYNSNNLSNFDNIIENLDNNNRFELSDKSINYLYVNNLENLTINSKNNNLIDISILENIDNDISEFEYKNIPIFKDGEIILNIDTQSNSLNINLPINKSIINFQNQNNNSSSTDEKINYIISNIKSSKMEFYLKDRYIRRIEFYRKNKDEKYLNILKNRVNDAVSSISKFSYNLNIKNRYLKIKEDYMYLNLLLLIL